MLVQWPSISGSRIVATADSTGTLVYEQARAALPKIGRAMRRTIRRGISNASRHAMRSLAACGFAELRVRAGFIGYVATDLGDAVSELLGVRCG
jgi:hypothetical protein